MHHFTVGTVDGCLVQILASALPGFRDLRAPLAAGYMWLAFVWILIKPDIKTRPTNEVAGAVYDLALSAGPIWLALATGILAYLTGSVSQAASPALSRGMTALLRRSDKVSGERLMRGDGGKMTRVLRKVAIVGTGAQHDAIEEYEMKAVTRLYLYPTVTSDGQIINPDKEVGEKGGAARRALEAELELPATLLLGNEPMLFSEADRLKAERELRLAVVPPLVAISVYLALTQSHWWLLALIPVLILLSQGHTRNLAFRSLMIGAVQLGAVRSRSVEEFRSWVENIPEHTPEQREIFNKVYGQPDFGTLRFEILCSPDDIEIEQTTEFGDFAERFAYRGFIPDLFYRELGESKGAGVPPLEIAISISPTGRLLRDAAATVIDVVGDWAQERIHQPGAIAQGDRLFSIALYGPNGLRLQQWTVTSTDIEEVFTYPGIAKDKEG